MIQTQQMLPVEKRNLRLAASLDSAALQGLKHPTDDAYQAEARHE